MAYRARANPDQRRRRVILEETRNETGAVVEPPRTGPRDKRYADDVLGEAQPRVTDLLVSSARGVLGIVALLVAIDAGVVALHWFYSEWKSQLPDLPVDALDASHSDSLAHMLVAGKCVFALALSVLIFAVRRRRLDDLRGTYQTWAWAAVAIVGLLLLSTTAIENLVAYGIAKIPSIPAVASPRHYFLAAFALVAVPALVRVMIEMRRSRAANVFLAVAAIAVVFAEFIGILGLDARITSTISASMTLFAPTMLCASLLSYGSHVKQEAIGSGRRRKKRKKVSSEEAVAITKPIEKPAENRQATNQSPQSRPGTIGAAISAAKQQDRKRAA